MKLSERRDETTQAQIASWLEKNIVPTIGHIPIADLRALDVLDAVRNVEERGAIDSAKRVLAYCDQIFQYAIATEAVTVDVTAGLYRALETKQHYYAAITSPTQTGALLCSIDAYPTIRSSVQRVAPLVFVLPGELRTAEWEEIDLDAAELRIPSATMKMGLEHIVTLAD